VIAACIEWESRRVGTGTQIKTFGSEAFASLYRFAIDQRNP